MFCNVEGLNMRKKNPGLDLSEKEYIKSLDKLKRRCGFRCGLSYKLILNQEFIRPELKALMRSNIKSNTYMTISC